VLFQPEEEALMSATSLEVMPFRSRFRFAGVAPCIAGLLVAAAGFALPAVAQNFPVKPVRIVVGYPAGGPVDTVARIVAPRLTELLGQQVVIENRPGASGNIAGEHVSKATADGYTLLLTAASITSNPHLYRTVGYDALRDLAPVSLLTSSPLVMAVHPSVPVKTVKDVIAVARARPGQLQYASSGVGGAPHLAAELFKSMAKVDLMHIPYKGVAPAVTDVMGGQVPILFSNTVSVLPHVQVRRMRALGVTGEKRSAAAPEIPAIAETLPGYEMMTWQAIMAPAATPPAAISRLNAALVSALQTPAIRDQYLRQGSEPVGSTAEELGARIKRELASWARVIKEAGIPRE